MEKRRSHNWTYLFFRMSTLFFAFFAVLYAMRYVSSRQFTEGVSAIFGAKVEKPLLLTQESQWCGQDTEAIQIQNKETKITDVNQIQDLCNLQIQSADKSTLEQGLFNYSVVATSKSGEIKIIEYDSVRALFKQEGLVFQSKILSDKVVNAFSIQN